MENHIGDIDSVQKVLFVRKRDKDGNEDQDSNIKIYDRIDVEADTIKSHKKLINSDKRLGRSQNSHKSLDVIQEKIDERNENLEVILSNFDANLETNQQNYDKNVLKNNFFQNIKVKKRTNNNNQNVHIYEQDMYNIPFSNEKNTFNYLDQSEERLTNISKFSKIEKNASKRIKTAVEPINDNQQ